VGAQAAAQRQPVFARQHQVEQDQVDPGLGQDLVHGAPVAGGRDAKAFLDEGARDELADLAVVVDDEDMGSTLHAVTIDQPWSKRMGDRETECVGARP